MQDLCAQDSTPEVFKAEHLRELVNGGQIDKILEVCIEAQLEEASKGRDHPAPAEHLLALLIANRAHESKFLWRQLSDSTKANTDVSKSWRVAAALLKRDWNTVYAELQERNWSSHLLPLTNRLLTSTRARVFKLLARAYSTISVNRASHLLGLPQDVTIQECTAAGWHHAGGFLEPRTRRAEIESIEPPNAAQALAEMENLTEQLVRLQTAV